MSDSDKRLKATSARPPDPATPSHLFQHLALQQPAVVAAVSAVAERDTAVTMGGFVDGVFSMPPSPSPSRPTSGGSSCAPFAQLVREHALAQPVREYALEEIWIRDPYIVVAPAIKDKPARYLLFGTTDCPPPGASPYSAYPATGFSYYTASSLAGKWTGPFVAFSASAGFWANTQFWAPEVCQYSGQWYLTGTFSKLGGHGRGVQCLRSQSGLPEGPYAPMLPSQLTPRGQYCLDGSLYFGETEPHLVFCREHVEVGIGRVCAMPLSARLDQAAGEAFDLFSATDAEWVRAVSSSKACVTDGCLCWRARATKELLLTWSSIGEGGKYMVGVARSASGSIHGPWTHDAKPLFENDGGHAMLFRPLASDACAPLHDGESAPPLLMALHSPNKDVMASRCRIFRISETVVNGKLELRVL